MAAIENRHFAYERRALTLRRHGTTEHGAMRFGLFGSAQAKRPEPGAELTDSSQGFREWIDNNVEAEALGYYSTFVVEHHFTGFGQVSASLNLLTWLGARTTTLRLGTAVLVLPWHNPVLLAEQAATLDLLSGGRLDFGIGKGYRYNEFAGFAMPMEEADPRFEESLDVLTRAFTSDVPWSHKGKFWQFDNVVVEPPSAQRPHPPFWMGAGSERSVRQVAERGYNMLLGQYDLAHQVIGFIAQFKRDIALRGRAYNPLEIGVARAVHFADTPEALEAARVRRFQGHLRINKLAERPGDERERFARHDEAEVRQLCDDTALFGTPDQIADKLTALRDGGVEYVVVNFGGSRANIRRFAREIMPHFAGEPRLDFAAK
jgi:alkanesulfonate monooxygenase SsuD/methylene tetrahydromethanopterin reductase-like flavin-dependent oxidoreductase (luciferase family)